MFRPERAVRYFLIKHPTKIPWTHHTKYSLRKVSCCNTNLLVTLTNVHIHTSKPCPAPNQDRRSFSQTTGARIVVVSLGLM